MVDTTAEPKDQEEQFSPSEPKLDAAGPSNLAKFSNFKDAGAVAAARKINTTTTEFKRMSDLTVVRKRRQADSVNAPNKENSQEPEKEQEQQTPEDQKQTQAEQPEQQNAPETPAEEGAQSPEATPEATPETVPTDDGRVRNEPEPEKEKEEPEQPEEDSDEDEDDDEDLEAAMLEAQAEDQARTKKAKELETVAKLKLKDDAEVLAGKEFVTFIWSTVVESLGIGLLWAIPTFDVYILIGLFSKRPLYHQLPKWQIAGILILNVLVLLFIIMLISLVFKTVCTGIIAGTFRKVGSLFSDTVNSIDEVCKQVKPLIEDLPDLGT